MKIKKNKQEPFNIFCEKILNSHHQPSTFEANHIFSEKIKKKKINKYKNI